MEGKPEQMNDYSEVFSVRNSGKAFYISWKGGPHQVYGTDDFAYYHEAKNFLRDNWKRLIDNEFEREVLDGSGDSTANEVTES